MVSLNKISLRNRLLGVNLLVFLAVILTVVAIFSISVTRQRQVVRETIEIHLDGAKEKLVQGFYTYYHQVQSYTKNPILAGEDKEAKQFILNELVSLFPENELLVLVNSQGIVQASSTIDSQVSPLDSEKLAKLDFSKESWIKDFNDSKNVQDIEKKIFGSHMLQPQKSQMISEALGKDWTGTPFIAAVDDGFGSVLGYLISFRNMSWIQRDLNKLQSKLRESGWHSTEISLLSSEGKVRATTKKEAIGENSSLELKGLQTALEKGAFEDNTDGIVVAHFIGGERFVDAIDWNLVIEAKKSEIFSDIVFFERVTYTALGLLAILSSFFILLLANRMYRRLTEVHQILTQTSKRNFEFVDKLRGTADHLSSSSRKQLEQVKSASSGLAKILENAGDSANSAKLTFDSSESSSTYSADGKKRMQDVSQSIDKISQSSSAIIGTVSKMNEQLTEIANMVETIGERTSMINDISFQTKILSFNASVEAARAGETGKGFAVVAEEMGKLAQSSGQAADEISEIFTKSKAGIYQIISENQKEIQSMISETNSSIEGGLEKTDSCRRVLDQISEQTSQVTEFAANIQLKVADQKEEIKNIEQSMRNLDDGSQNVKDASEDTLQISHHIGEESAELSSALEKLSTEIHGKDMDPSRKVA